MRLTSSAPPHKLRSLARQAWRGARRFLSSVEAALFPLAIDQALRHLIVRNRLQRLGPSLAQHRARIEAILRAAALAARDHRLPARAGLARPPLPAPAAVGARPRAPRRARLLSPAARLRARRDDRRDRAAPALVRRAGRGLPRPFRMRGTTCSPGTRAAICRPSSDHASCTTTSTTSQPFTATTLPCARTIGAC